MNHSVLPTTESRGFRSVRESGISRPERFALGEALRQQVPYERLGEWAATSARFDPIALIAMSHVGRVPDLVGIRVARMATTPYGFLRGSAAVMAADVASLPSTGIHPVICGDAHLGNFGFYRSPEGAQVIDLNDFDEAHPGSWEWDLRRLVASVWVAGRENGYSEQACAASARSCVVEYAAEVGELASEPLLARSFNRLDVSRLKALGERQEPAYRDQAGRQGRPQAHQRPRPAEAHRRRGRAPPDHPRAADHHFGGRGGGGRHRRRPRRLPRQPRAALATGGRRLHPRGRRPSGGRRRLRRPARLRGAAGGLQPRRRAVPAAEGGAALGAGPLRPRRRRLARPPGPAGRGVPAGAADGERPAAGLDDDRRAASTTCASSAT